MATLNDLLSYAKTALEWAAIPEEETEFRSILIELTVVSAQIPITFLNENYGNKAKIISDAIKIPERKLGEWLSQQDEAKGEYYLERLMLFLKAYATIEAKSHPSKNEINETYSFLQEILQDRMDIDDDPDMRATFTPFVEHIGKVRPKKETKTASRSPDKNNYFISTLSKSQKKILAQELKEQKYTTTPHKLMNFLGGDNDAMFKINSEKAHHMAYLLYKLVVDGYISINKGAGFWKHFESHNGREMGSVGMAELKRQVLDGKYNKTHVQQDVQKIIDRLKTR